MKELGMEPVYRTSREYEAFLREGFAAMARELPKIGLVKQWRGARRPRGLELQAGGAGKGRLDARCNSGEPGSLPPPAGRVGAAGAMIAEGVEQHERASPTDPHRPSRSEEHTSELQSLMRISYAVFRLKKKKTNNQHTTT